MSLADYEANLGWIRDAYTLLLADYESRVAGTQSKQSLSDVKTVAKNFAGLSSQLLTILDTFMEVEVKDTFWSKRAT